MAWQTARVIVFCASCVYGSVDLRVLKRYPKLGGQRGGEEMGWMQSRPGKEEEASSAGQPPQAGQYPCLPGADVPRCCTVCSGQRPLRTNRGDRYKASDSKDIDSVPAQKCPMVLCMVNSLGLNMAPLSLQKHVVSPWSPCSLPPG